MKKVDRIIKRRGNSGDIYDLNRFAAHVLEYKDNFNEFFKINYKDANNIISIVNVNKNINDKSAIESVIKKNNNEDNRYTVFINEYDNTNKIIEMVWPRRNCIARMTFKEKNISE